MLVKVLKLLDHNKVEYKVGAVIDSKEFKDTVDDLGVKYSQLEKLLKDGIVEPVSESAPLSPVEPVSE